MGMRASIITIDKERLISITAVQWSTRLDITLASFLNACKKKEGTDAARIESALTFITGTYGHIGAVEWYPGLLKDSYYDPSHEEPSENIIQGLLQVSGSTLDTYSAKELKRRSKSIEDFDSYADAIEWAMNYHLDGGSIGVIHDANVPDSLKFFYSNYDEETDTDEVALEEIPLHRLRAGHIASLERGIDPKDVKKQLLTVQNHRDYMERKGKK